MSITTRVLAAVAWLATGFLASGYYRTSLHEISTQHGLEETRSTARLEAAVSVLFILAGPLYLVATFAVSGAFDTGFESPFSQAFWNGRKNGT